MRRKRKKVSLELIVGIASLITSVISVMGVVWVGAFKLSTLTHEVQDIKEDVRDIKIRLNRIEDDFHKMDVRVNHLEH